METLLLKTAAVYACKFSRMQTFNCYIFNSNLASGFGLVLMPPSLSATPVEKRLHTPLNKLAKGTMQNSETKMKNIL